MDFTQATVTKLDNGYVVHIQTFSTLKNQNEGVQLIAKDLQEALGFLGAGAKPTSTIALQGVKN